MVVFRAVFAVAIRTLLPLRQIGRIGRGDARLPNDLSAMGLGKRRVRQTNSRFEEGSRVGSAGAIDTRHGGPPFVGAVGRGTGGGGGWTRGDIAISILG